LAHVQNLSPNQIWQRSNQWASGGMQEMYSLCDFFIFFCWSSDISTDFYAKWLKWCVFMQAHAFYSKNLKPWPHIPKTAKIC